MPARTAESQDEGVTERLGARAACVMLCARVRAQALDRRRRCIFDKGRNASGCYEASAVLFCDCSVFPNCQACVAPMGRESSLVVFRLQGHTEARPRKVLAAIQEMNLRDAATVLARTLYVPFEGSELMVLVCGIPVAGEDAANSFPVLDGTHTWGNLALTWWTDILESTWPAELKASNVLALSQVELNASQPSTCLKVSDDNCNCFMRGQGRLAISTSRPNMCWGTAYFGIILLQLL